MRYGIIDMGGGFRGIYGAGVYDRLMDQGIVFDMAIGVSAGSANLGYYLAGQRGRIKRYYNEFNMRPEYASLHNYLHTHSFLNLDYIYSTLANTDGEEPLDHRAFMASPCRYEAVACNALTGKARYFDKSEIRLNHYDAMKASSALPVYCRPYVIDGVPYYDGGIVDPAPVERAFANGCDRVVLVMTRPRDFRRTAHRDRMDANLIQHRYPQAAKTLARHYLTYNGSLDAAEEYAKQGRVLIVAPDALDGMSTLTRDLPKLEAFYQKGYHDAAAIAVFMGR